MAEQTSYHGRILSHPASTPAAVSRLGAIYVAAAAMLVSSPVVGCGDPNPVRPTPRAALTLESFAVTATAVPGGLFRYGARVTLRETAGFAAALSSVTVAVTDRSGTASESVISPAEAFGASRIPGHGTLISTILTSTGVLRAANTVLVRVTFQGDNGAAGAAESSTGVPFDLTGTWTGPLPIRTPIGDWSRARASLTHAGESISGDLASRDDAHYAVSGTVFADGALISLGGLPGTSTCSAVFLAMTRFEFEGGRVQRAGGVTLGRCFGTIAGEFQLERD